MINKTAYDTSYLSILNRDKVLENVRKYVIIDYYFIKEKLALKLKSFSNAEVYLDPVVLCGLSTLEQDIDHITQALVDASNKISVLDLRFCTKPNKDKTDIEVRNESEYTFTVNKYILSNLWFVGRMGELRDLKFGYVVFSAWLSDNLAKRFGLDLGDTFKLKVLALLYYHSLFVEKLDQDEADKLYIRFKSEFLLSEELMGDIFKKVGHKLSNAESFCEACYAVTDNVRLKGLNMAVLSTVIANSWFGLNAKENIMVGLEYPPVFVSMVQAALESKSYSKSSLGQIVARLNKKDKGAEFLKALEGVVGAFKE